MSIIPFTKKIRKKFGICLILGRIQNPAHPFLSFSFPLFFSFPLPFPFNTMQLYTPLIYSMLIFKLLSVKYFMHIALHFNSLL